MSDEKSDNVLMFLMVGGVMFASEPNIDLKVGYKTPFEAFRYRGGALIEFFEAIRPDNGETFLINIRNCLSVQLVPREAVIAGKRIVEPAANLGGLH